MLAPIEHRPDDRADDRADDRIRRPATLTAVAVIVTVGAAIVGYLLYRSFSADASLVLRAGRNAASVVGVQERSGLAVERHLQQSWVGQGVVGAALVVVYGLGYWPTLLSAFAVTLWRDRAGARRLVWAFAASGLVGLVVIAAFPVAPPRLVGALDDQLAGTGIGSIAHPSGWFHPYAAMPSFHVAWTSIAAAALRRSVGRGVWLVPALMSIAVVTTGNHWILDVVAGWLLALAAWSAAPVLHRAAVRGIERHTRPRRAG